MGGRARSPLVGVVVGLLLFLSAGVATAQTPPTTTPAEAYPPAAVVNLVDPFPCEPSEIAGEIGVVLPGSTVNLTLVMLSPTGGSALLQVEVLGTATATAGADGHARYTIPVPPNRFGTIEVRASGVNTLNQPFTLATSGIIEECPAELPATGNTGTGLWLRLGAGAVLAGALLVVLTLRRRRHPVAGTG
jgi:LPXTG-motif cell wall-anchored protein